MTRRTTQTIADAITILVALWFLRSDAFAEIRSPVIEAVAIAVLLYSVFRIARRHWTRP